MRGLRYARMLAVLALGAATVLAAPGMAAAAVTVPSVVPPGAAQWSGLSSVNNGTGTLLNHNNNQNLFHNHSTLGVDLDFQSGPSLWRVQSANGSANLVKGQQVALRVWGGGWLKTGSPVFGIGLEMNLDTPAYQWYVLGGGALGDPLNNGTFALWNSVQNDFLIYDPGAGLGVVSLNWYKTVHGSQPPPPSGIKTFRMFNCSVQQHSVEVWIADLTAGGGYVDHGTLNQQYGSSGCIAPGSVPFVFVPPVSGHVYRVVATDKFLPACPGLDDPTIGACQKSVSAFTSLTTGATETVTIDIGVQITP